jgi:uncharacterized metal-binding protein
MGGCGCGKLVYNLVFACSGAADVGAVSDLAARRAAGTHSTAMACTAAVAAGDAEALSKARNAARIVVVDGCDKRCAATVMRNAGFDDFGHVEITALGYEKGRTGVADEVVAAITERIHQAVSPVYTKVSS